MKQSTIAIIMTIQGALALLSVSDRAFADCSATSETSIASTKKLDESDDTRSKPDDADSDDGGSKAGAGEMRSHHGRPPGGDGFGGGPGGPPGGNDGF